MLDQSMLEQVKEVFSKLDAPVSFRLLQSAHADFNDLKTMLEQLAASSPFLNIIEDQATSPVPYFELLSNDKDTGIAFRGIPGGHEFTSLILSILYSNGKGKQPDDGIVQRIQNLKGPVSIKTYISLECENCPEVVQALNLMASLHPEFQHEMIDGNYAQDEVKELGLQGVPAVVVDGKLLHSGKIQLIDLLAKLEQYFGLQLTVTKEKDLGLYDVAIIGAGPAGASAAIYSARKGLRTVMIAEKFGGQLQETKGIENMISKTYTEGNKLAAELAQHVQSYPVKILEHRRVQKISNDSIKRIDMDSGEFLHAKALIVATGAKWRELGIPGEKEHIGQGVAFCAHCDGPFFKGKKVAVVGGGNSGVEAAIDLSGLASEVVLLEYGDTLKADGVLIEKLKSLPNVSILTNAKSTQVIGDGKKVSGLEYQDRKTEKLNTIDLDGIFVQIGLLPNSQFVKGLVETTPYGEIIVDAKGHTSVPGIYAAGDVTTVPFKQIVIAMGEGAKVALTAFEDRLHAPKAAS